MKFTLPEVLPTGETELDELHAEAMDAFNELKAKVEAGEDLTDVEMDELKANVEAVKVIEAAQDELAAAASARAEAAAALVAELSGETETEGEDEDSDAEDADDVEVIEVIDADDVIAEAEKVAEEAVSVTAAGRKVPGKAITKFAPNRAARRTAQPPAKVDQVGFRMTEGVVGYKPGLIGFAEFAAAIDAVRPGARARANRPDRGARAAMTLARMERAGLPLIEDSHELVKEITRVTDPSLLRQPTFDNNGSLTAAGGWCAPSETLYDFCDVPTATDLISIPEITIRRGGVRWPVEPDLSAIFESFEFFFTEPELEALPPVVKECVEIPCPDEFEEIRLAVVGYCVEAGILQAQGWPELIEWFMRSLTQEHFRALSRRTINDMVAGSTPIAIPAPSQMAAGSSVLNSLELMAVNLRLKKGLSRTATIEGVAPVWLHPVIRADLANQQGTETKAVTDAQINGWLSARNIALQFVADWQTRGVGQPGDLNTVEYPATVRVLLYPAGTWFRALSNVIEFGVTYPRELLQINRYSQFFTEDAIAVAKRCNDSIVVTIPICPNGAYGEQAAITCNTASNEVQNVGVTGTVPTGGTFTLTFQDQTTGPIAYNASAAAVKTALDALANLEVGDTATAGGPLPGGSVTVTFQGKYSGADVEQMTADGKLLTGGDATTKVVVTTTTQGGV